MGEQFTPEEAFQEAQFIKQAASETEGRIGDSGFEAAKYESLSKRLDAMRQNFPGDYEIALRLGDLGNEAEVISPDLRQRFIQIVGPASRSALEQALSRENELRAYINGGGSETEKINEIVDECIKTEIDRVDKLVAADQTLQNMRPEDLEKLRRYHLGTDAQSVLKIGISNALKGLLKNWPNG